MSHLIGHKISDFTAQAYQQGAFKEITAKNLQGHWSIFFFYPADFTFVCPTELGDLADHYQTFQGENCEIYAVSTDTHFTHKAWADQTPTIGKVQYPMLGDPNWALSKEFGVLIEDAGQALRGTFIVNPEGVIVAYEIHDLGIGRSVDELLRKLQAAKFVAEHGDQVCPANWKPGGKTLKPGLDLVGKL